MNDYERLYKNYTPFCFSMKRSSYLIICKTYFDRCVRRNILAPSTTVYSPVDYLSFSSEIFIHQ